jgi:PilZ domain
MGSINNREHDRFPFTSGMWVKAVRPNQPISEFKMYQLIDISQSGISFKSHDRTEFKRGDNFYILEVESPILEDEIKAIVRYVKPLDEFGVDYKVGVEFIGKL